MTTRRAGRLRVGNLLAFAAVSAVSGGGGRCKVGMETIFERLPSCECFRAVLKVPEIVGNAARHQSDAPPGGGM